MKRNKSNLLADTAFLLLFFICFISIVFMGGNPDRFIQNIILLNVAFLFAVVTYFTTVTSGLILNILFIFGYGTYTLYQTVLVGDVIGSQSYFWLVMTPVFTLVTWMLTRSQNQLQTENDLLRRTNETQATMDENTNLKNSRSFLKDATVFMALSVRYKIPLTLLVINVRYWDELKRMISEDQMSSAVYDLSQLNETSIRTNDSLYMLNKENPTWGMLLFTDRMGANLVIDRLVKTVEDYNRNEFKEKYKIELNLKIGATEFDSEAIHTPIDFIMHARKQLEFDV